ncbi:ABC-2 type transport system ATP-binding protein [Brevibacterium jeotgali]|nr:ABC-2 type transport system ATP-binding protein [Brevibacterium jeotgali]
MTPRPSARRPSPPEHPVVDVSGLRKSFGDHEVLKGIDLSVEEGEVFALIGPNGAGKTTTVHILSTLVRPDAGRARVGGFDLLREADGVRDVISLTGQYAAVDGLLTGRENLEMMSRLGGLSRSESRRRTAQLLERFDLGQASGRRVRTYSGGMRRRLDIAISLVTRPRVLFLDEPTTGLDPCSRSAVWDFVRELADDGVTILLTTQYLEEADRLADRVAVVDDGVIAASGTSEQLKAQIGSSRLDVGFHDGEVESYPTDGSVAGVHGALTRVLSDPREAQSVDLRSPSLDDVFLALIGHASAQHTSDHTSAQQSTTRKAHTS